MRLHVGLSVRGLALLGCAFAMATPALAAPDPEEAQFTCSLTGDDCDAVANPAAGAEQPAAATPGKPAPRGSATRGFSFRRGAAEGSAPQTSAAVIAAPAAKTAKPVRVGSADLGLTFKPASAVLTEESKARLGKYVNALQTPKLSSRRLRIEGHTDASGSARANQDLSRRRAQAVADYLVQAGIDRARLEVAGYGSSKPLPGTAPQSAANRRVMAVLL
jgi:OmpA-OmpF porin, OOP family